MVRSSQPSAPLRTSTPRSNNGTGNAVTGAADLPSDTLIEIFQQLRQEVVFFPVASFDQSAKTENTAHGIAAPQLSITAVCKSWRNTAMNAPHLWATIPILLEDFGSLCVGNPGQISYYLSRTKKIHPLKLIIGNRGQLSGPGVKAEYPILPLRFELLQRLAHRVTELTLAFDQRDNSASELFNSQHDFTVLERLWLQGTISKDSSPAIHAAGFWRSPSLRAVTWAVSTIGSAPPLDTPPWINLTELVIHEHWEVVLQAEAVRTFLAVAISLVKFEVQVCECAVDNDNFWALDGRRIGQNGCLSLPTTMRHDRLQTLGVTFHGPSLGDTPALLQGLELPKLQSFIFGADFAANFDPTAVVAWVGSGSHALLTYLEVSVDLVNMADLIQALTRTPLLEVLKCVGSMVGCYYDSERVATLFSRPSFNPYTDDQFLRSLSPARAYDAAEVGGPMCDPIGIEDIPCPLLRELQVTNGYFSGAAIEAFVKARLYGGGSRKDFAPGFPTPLAPLRSVTVEDLVTTESVYETRNLVRRLKGEYGVILVVKSGIYPSIYSERWSV